MVQPCSNEEIHNVNDETRKHREMYSEPHQGHESYARTKVQGQVQIKKHTRINVRLFLHTFIHTLQIKNSNTCTNTHQDQRKPIFTYIFTYITNQKSATRILVRSLPQTFACTLTYRRRSIRKHRFADPPIHTTNTN